MASRIIKLWGRPRQSKSQVAEADSNHVPPEQEGDCQVEIANNENSNESKKKSGKFNLNYHKQNFARIKRNKSWLKFWGTNFQLRKKFNRLHPLCKMEENCQEVCQMKTNFVNVSPYVRIVSQIFGMAAGTDLLDSTSWAVKLCVMAWLMFVTTCFEMD